MRRYIFLLSLYFPLLVSAAFIQYPAFTPEGGITFTAQGDVWHLPPDAQRAERLTSHLNLELEALMSPAGDQLAFVTDRYGDNELAVLSLTDNRTRRLTWTDTRKHLCFWDGDRLYATEKAGGVFPRRYRLYRWPAGGGEAELIIADICGSADLAPDGERIVYTRGDIRWTRKNYRGSGNNDLVVYHIGSGRFQQLTDSDWNENWGMFSADGKQIYFVSDEDSTRNLYRYNLAGGVQEQLTHFEEDGVLFPRLNRERTRIVFTVLGQLHLYDIATGVIQKLEPLLVAPPAFNTITREPVDGKAGSFCVSPDQKWIVAAVRGDLFLTRREDERTRQLTDDNWHNSRPHFSVGGDTLFFLSNRGGLTGVWALTHSDTALTLAEDYHHTFVQVTNLDQVVYEFALAPDGRRLALTCGLNRILLRDLERNRTTELTRGYQPRHLAWYDDSRWLLFQSEDNEFNQDVFLIDTEEGTRVNISNHPKNDFNGCISSNGFWVFWINDARDYTTVLRATLTRKIWQMQEEDIEDRLDGDSTASALRIDPEGLFDRVIRLDHPSGRVRQVLISPDNRQIAYLLRRDHRDHLYRAEWNGEEEKEIASGKHLSGLQWLEKGNRIYFRDGGRIKQVGVDGGKSETVRFRGEQRIDQLALQSYKFQTLWQRTRDWFYDSDYHGVDWERMYHKYHDLAAAQVLDADFNTITKMMLGELNSSHQNVTGGQLHIDGDAASFLGVTCIPVRRGDGRRVSEVMPHGPADLGEAGLLPGDILLEIEHVRLCDGLPLQSLLIGREEEPTALLVRREGEELVLNLTPCSTRQINRLAYRRWVDDNRHLVEQAGDGRVAYVHISGMNWRSTTHFERELFARTRDCEALIIDVRDNGGGYTTDYLLTMLNYQPHAYTIGRDGEPGYPQGRIPFYYWHKPVVVICNEHSFSNAEIFTHAVKTLDRARVVGQPTFGGVISTDGFSLEDGTYVRQPFRGWYTIDAGLNLENNGCRPHVIVELGPDAVREERDPQLETAVQEALLLLR